MLLALHGGLVDGTIVLLKNPSNSKIATFPLLYTNSKTPYDKHSHDLGSPISSVNFQTLKAATKDERSTNR